MNRNLRTLLVAAPISAAAVLLAPGAALADGPSGPGTIGLAPHVDPQGPVIANPTPAPTPDPVPDPQNDDKVGPKQDQDPRPEPLPRPGIPGDDEPTGPHDGPGTISDDPEQCPTHGECGETDVPTDEPTDEPDQGCFTGCDLPEEPTTEETTVDSFPTPNRIDAGAGDAAQHDGLELTWLLAGGAAVTAAGVAFAARRKARTEA